MRRISGGFRLLVRWRWPLLAASMVWGGCFPAPVERADVTIEDADTGSGQDTTLGGDTGPGQDTAAVDTAAPDTVAPDTVAPDTVAPDTVAPECDGPEDCGHLAGRCTKVVCLGGTCAAQPDSGASCDDGDPCTRADLCSGFSCAGTAYSCDDGELCTDNVCDGAGGCDYPAKPGFCWIAGTCYDANQTKPGDPCRICAGGETWAPNDGATCSDGDDVCTLGDTCDGTQCVGGPPPDDTPGNWAIDIVHAVSPQRSKVTAIHPIGVADWAIFATLTGGGTVPTSAGDESFDNDAVVIVRKAPVSSWVAGKSSSADGVTLDASASSGGRIAWGITLNGPGESDYGTSSFAKTTSGPTSYIGATDGVGDLRFFREAVGTAGC